jgi:glutamyl-tRNA reductase
MSLTFKALTINYKNSPVEVRERFAFTKTDAASLLLKLKDIEDVEDLLLISTCNRTELYYSGEVALSKVAGFLCAEKGLKYGDYKSNIGLISAAQEAAEYLFRVSLGLEAQVVGDIQISNQVKQAYQMSSDLNLAGPFLHRLMHTIFFANKRSIQETAFRDGAASVSYASTELVESLTSEVKNPKVLLIGVGDIGKNVCKNISESDHLEVTVTNRTKTRAIELASEYGFTWKPFEKLNTAISEADVIITSVSAPDPLITKNLLESVNLNTFKYFIDLSVPRSVQPEVEEFPGVVVYNIDQIRSKADEALENRLAAIPEVENIIEESLYDFKQWTKEMEVSPTIKKLKGALDNIRKEEISRYMSEMSDTEREKVDLITKGMLQKIIKLPVLQLKAACKRGEADTLVDILHDLFDLEKEKQKE